MPVLVLARFLQGFGGGSIAPTAYSAIGRSLPPSLRPTMFALAATAWVVPGLIAPAVAGVVAEQVGWRIVFIGVLCLLLWLTYAFYAKVFTDTVDVELKTSHIDASEKPGLRPGAPIVPKNQSSRPPGDRITRHA